MAKMYTIVVAMLYNVQDVYRMISRAAMDPELHDRGGGGEGSAHVQPMVPHRYFPPSWLFRYALNFVALHTF